MSEIYYAPERVPYRTLFLAGSIDMGSAADWQMAVTSSLREYPVRIFNPRRKDWDSSWKQDISNGKFKEQVEWELEQLEKSDIICFYFDPKGQAPITLMELGLFAMSGKEMVVCCPSGYWRRGNVQVVCDRYGIPLTNFLGDMIDYLKDVI